MRLKKVIFLFNIIVSGIYIIFIKIQLNPFQDTLINYTVGGKMVPMFSSRNFNAL